MVKKCSSLSALGGLVYSTDVGRLCPVCNQAIDRCVCNKGQVKGDGIVRVRKETKGRGGKVVTTISGILVDEAALKELAGALKRRCGTGGTVKEGTIEIQGEHIQLLMDELVARGFNVKRSGG